MQRVVWCLLVAVWCTATGCRARQEIRQSERVETAAFRTDSLTVAQAMLQWHNRTVDIRHIEWSMPDSMERQYVRSVTLVTASEEAAEESVSEAVAVGEEEVYGITEKETGRRTPAGSGWTRRWWIWVVGAVAMALLVKFLKNMLYNIRKQM